MRPQDLRERPAEFVCDLQQEGARQAILKIGRDKPADMAEVVPDRALQEISLQSVQRRRGQKIIKPDGSCLVRVEGAQYCAAVRTFADGGLCAYRRRRNEDRRIVVLAEQLKLPLGKLGCVRTDFLRHLFVRSREDREAASVAAA